MTVRLFAALPVPDEIAIRVEPLQKGVSGARWRPKENFHITLCFYGEMDESAAMELDHELGRISVAPFELRLKSAGHFGNNPPSVLWLGVEGPPELFELARLCEKAARRAGLQTERRTYTPHLTVAYLQNPDIERVQKFEKRLGLYRSEPFIADRFHLYSSWRRDRGPNRYVDEAEYPLIA